MKKQLLIAFAMVASLIAVSQNSIPNGNFENWNSATYDFPQGYPQNSNAETFFRCQTPFNLTKSTDAFQGAFALQLTTNASVNDTCGAYLLNATDANGNPSSWQGGIPYTEQATGISGHYKYNQASGDSGLIIVVFKNAGTTIGTYFFLIGGNYTTYQTFSFPLVPALPMAPDSVIFAAASSNLIAGEGIPGSILLLDSISFTGVASQPTQMNGDFEIWSSNSLNSPLNWEAGGSDGRGFARSNDAAGGTYAIELTTYAGDNNGVPRASAGYVENGYYDNNCNCYIGGNPFSNQIDTLVLSYKYAPTIATDSAFISLGFKNNGTPFSFVGHYFIASPIYLTVEVPINLSSQPDSVFIQIQSNQWQDSSMNHVGATLLIDEIHFKSQAIGLKKNILLDNTISFFPNPMKNSASILISKNINIDNTVLIIYDVLGNEVKNSDVTSHKITFEKESLPAGIYTYKLVSESQIVSTGKIIIE
ncbi:MAG: T9SS type A sorting domain-containing protein [Bacteroidota bacterium]|nr:T9SS type A sorting domain-containing protein [Bacteroidota bacterium]